MNVIALVSSKGGVGKTTLASALAVRAAKESKRVAMVDLDPMGSLAAWWKRRGKTENPCIFRGADTAGEAVEALELDGWDWVFIDTPPAFLARIEDAINNCHVAVIPLRASSLDLVASEDAVLIAREVASSQVESGDVPVAHLCVINDAEPRWKATNAVRDYLLASSVPLAEAVITHRASYLSATAAGKSGPEIERAPSGQKQSVADREISALWSEIKAALRNRKRSRQ